MTLMEKNTNCTVVPTHKLLFQKPTHDLCDTSNVFNQTAMNVDEVPIHPPRLKDDTHTALERDSSDVATVLS